MYKTNNKFKQNFIKICNRLIMLYRLNITPPEVSVSPQDPPLFGNKQQNTYDFVNMLKIVKQKGFKNDYLEYNDYLTNNILLRFEWKPVYDSSSHHAFRCHLYSFNKYRGNIPLMFRII